MVPRALPLVLLSLPTSCGDDGGTATGGSSDSSAPPPASSSAGSSGGPGATSVVGGSSGSTSSGAVGDSTGMVDPPIFDLGVVPDAPIYDPYASDIWAVVVADGAVMLAYGSEEALDGHFGVVEDGPLVENCWGELEEYVIPGHADYIYLIAYADAVDTHGVLGVFERLSGYHGDVPPLGPGPTYTGDSDWEVCATGVDFDPGDPWPDTSLIDDLLGQCTRGNTDPDTTSQGWVDREGTMLGAVEAGELNDTPLVGGPQPGNEFPVVCADYFGRSPRWMWFNWEPDTLVWPLQSPFIHPGGGGNPMHELLIFRLPRQSVPA